MTNTLTLRIEEMDCPTEESLIRQKLEGLQGVESLDFNLMQRKLTVRHHLQDPESIIVAVAALGMKPVVENASVSKSGSSQAIFIINNMDCPTEEALIRNKLTSMDGITALDFNLMQHKLTVTHTLGKSGAIQQALIAIDMNAVPLVATAVNVHDTPTPNSQRKWCLLGLGGVAAILAEVIVGTGGSEKSWPVIALALFAIAVSGTGTYKKGWIAVKNLNLNINALMSIAVTGAVLIGQWSEAAMVMVLFTLAEMIEAMSLDRARNAIRGLMEMTPDKANVLQADGRWQVMDAANISIGMIARVAPGERIPLDGELTKGQSAVNQAPITGESIPVAKTIGDKVFAGTINETGSFEYRITAAQTNSTLSRIIRAVEEAQGSCAPTNVFLIALPKYIRPSFLLSPWVLPLCHHFCLD
mgnify:CR=1 FL=1